MISRPSPTRRGVSMKLDFGPFFCPFFCPFFSYFSGGMGQQLFLNIWYSIRFMQHCVHSRKYLRDSASGTCLTVTDLPLCVTKFGGFSSRTLPGSGAKLEIFMACLRFLCLGSGCFGTGYILLRFWECFSWLSSRLIMCSGRSSLP